MSRIASVIKLKTGYANFVELKSSLKAARENADGMSMYRWNIIDCAKLRAEIDAYVAHLYGLSWDDFACILDTFPVLKKKEEKAFGEFMSKRKCLE